MNYDTWATGGYSHRCECGSVWTDADGGCTACEVCPECGGYFRHGEMMDYGTCRECAYLEMGDLMMSLEVAVPDTAADDWWSAGISPATAAKMLGEGDYFPPPVEC